VACSIFQNREYEVLKKVSGYYVDHLRKHPGKKKENAGSSSLVGNELRGNAVLNPPGRDTSTSRVERCNVGNELKGTSVLKPTVSSSSAMKVDCISFVMYRLLNTLYIEIFNLLFMIYYSDTIDLSWRPNSN